MDAMKAVAQLVHDEPVVDTSVGSMDPDGMLNGWTKSVPAQECGGAQPIPTLLLHGWPSSFVEMLPLADRLADPSRFSLGRAASAASLEGFLIRDRLG